LAPVREQFETVMLRFSTAIGLPLLACALWYGLLEIQIIEQRQRNHILLPKIAEYDNKIKEIKDLEKYKERYIAHVEVWQQTRLMRPPQLVEVLSEFSHIVPSKAWLNEVQIRSLEVMTQGQAETLTAIEQLAFAVADSTMYEHFQITVAPETVPSGTLGFKAYLQIAYAPRIEEFEE